ncbi:hypothetical protein BKA62DRAFT_716391 [Auriculariales sp. MPI-PUGE-AT-0066]|nr:hypothetical protein BKA62DRAFT_716391 [Auriculariales sp. MPI-PUGE-AT-0066]
MPESQHGPPPTGNSSAGPGPGPGPPYGVQPELVAYQLQSVAGTAVECICYGFHVVLIFLLLYNHSTQWRQRYVTLSASYTLFVLASAMCGMGLFLTIKGFRGLMEPGPRQGPPMFMDNLEWVRCALFIIAMLIGDGILSWRVCVLYRRSIPWMSIPHITAMAVAIGLGFASFACMIRTSAGHPFYTSVHCSRIMLQGQQGTWVISALLNITSTVLLGRIAWRHARILRGSGLKQNAVLRVLYILAISSAIYCMLWIPLIALLFVQATAREFQFVGPLAMAQLILQCAFHQLVGIYPTIVTYLTLQNGSIFSKEPDNSSSRTRKPTSEYGPGSYRISYQNRSRNIQVTVDETIQAYEDDTTSKTPSGKQFLPIEMEDLSPRSQTFIHEQSYQSKGSRVDKEWT